MHASLKAVLEIPLDQSSYFLGAQVIGIVVPSRQDICADHHPPSHLVAKPLTACVFIHIGNIAARHAQAVTNTVVAREIRRRLCGRHNVVRRQRIFCVRQRNFDKFGAGCFQPRAAALPDFLDFRRHSVEAIFFRNSNTQAFHRLSDCRLIVGHRHVRACRVFRIRPRHRTQEDRRIAHAARKRPRLVER